MDHQFKIGPMVFLSHVSHYLIKGLCTWVCIGICIGASAQTKKTIEYKAPNFGCTFEDGSFQAKIIATQNSLSKKSEIFLTHVDIQGCQVIHIFFDPKEKDFVANFKPTYIDDSGNAIILAERGIKYEIHLILP
jgi:hypothetical protein